MTPAERKAVAFFLAVGAVGAGARAVGLGDPPPAALSYGAGLGEARAEERAALARQIAAVDSARAAGRGDRRGRRRARAVEGAPARRRDVALTPPAAGADTRGHDGPPAAAGPVDVDRADSAALEGLPGVGPALARRIVADRDARGPFGSLGELSRVRGVGPRLEDRLRPFVTFSGRAVAVETRSRP